MTEHKDERGPFYVIVSVERVDDNGVCGSVPQYLAQNVARFETLDAAIESAGRLARFMNGE